MDIQIEIKKLLEAGMLFGGNSPEEKLTWLISELKNLSRVELPVKPACFDWQKEKPNKPCLMVTRSFYDGYNYQLFELNYMEGYLAVFCNDGIEWGDYNSLMVDEYFIIEYYDSKHSA